MQLFHIIRICGVFTLFLFYFLFLPSLFHNFKQITRFYRKISGHFTRPKYQWCQTLKFRNSPGPVVALVSYPGSGSTWLRYLVQQTTGIYTGSIYNDKELKKNGFPGEQIMDDSVILVNTHLQDVKGSGPFSHAVLLIRSPEQTALAEFNRKNGGRLGRAKPLKYLNNHGKEWKDFIQHTELDWCNLYIDWLTNFPGPKHVIFYENLLTNLNKELTLLHQFLNVTVPESRLKCAISRKEGCYHRRKKLLPFDPFTPAMRDSLKIKQTLVYQALSNNIFNMSLPSFEL